MAVPSHVHENLKAAAIAEGRSVTGIVRDLVDETFGAGAKTPQDLKTLVPEGTEVWPRITVYVSEETRQRALVEMKRRSPETQERRGRPAGAAAAIAFLLTAKYGGAA